MNDPETSRQDANIKDSVEIDGVHLKLSQPYVGEGEWIGQQEVLMQLLACWITVDDADLPLTPRLIGSPGVGKTQLAIAASKMHQKPLFIYQCTADTRPEDLLITPVLSRVARFLTMRRLWSRRWYAAGFVCWTRGIA